MDFLVIVNGEHVQVSGQPLMAPIGAEHRLLATFDFDDRKWLADVATGITLTTIRPTNNSPFSTRKTSGRGLALRMLAKTLHEKGERQVLAILTSQPVINPELVSEGNQQ